MVLKNLNVNMLKLLHFGMNYRKNFFLKNYRLQFMYFCYYNSRFEEQQQQASYLTKATISNWNNHRPNDSSELISKRCFSKKLSELKYSQSKHKLVLVNQPFSFIRNFNVAEQRCLEKFINLCMIDGKRNKSQKILIKTLYRLQHYGDVITFLMKAVDNVKPIIEVKKVRIAGSTQLVPSVIPKNRQENLAIRWILEAAFKRRSMKKSISLDQCLFAELFDAYNQIGTVRKRRDDLHKLAESNRGFAHYRWW